MRKSLTICMLVTSVHRPCLIISTQLLILGILLVKGAAILASPSFTIGISSISVVQFPIALAPPPHRPPTGRTTS